MTSSSVCLVYRWMKVIHEMKHAKRMEWEAYLRITKAMVREADIVYVLKNWEYSRGVKEELALAESLGKEIIYEPREVVIV